MTTTEAGRRAERLVALFLQYHGYKVIDKNWKTKTCEVDLIAYKDQAVFFVEVKYRGNSNQGTGFEYITAAKQKRMAYASRLWVAKYNWYGEYVLSGASVSWDGKVEFIGQI